MLKSVTLTLRLPMGGGDKTSENVRPVCTITPLLNQIIKGFANNEVFKTLTQKL